MKKLLTFFVAALCATGCFAQLSAKVSTQSAFDYNRCSLTLLPLSGTHENITAKLTEGQSFDGKFDVNKVNVKFIKGYDAESILRDLNAKGVGKQILDYWLGYDGKVFNSALMEERSRYNATDADVLADKAKKVSTLFTSGRDLINNSYVMVAGPSKVERKVNKKGKTFYLATIVAYVYHVDFNKDLLTTVWDNWLDSEMSEEELAKAKSVYDALQVNLQLEASLTEANRTTGLGDNPEEAIRRGMENIMPKLEGKIAKWQVVTTIYQRHPLGAKIGKKEAVKNSERYRAYKVVEDAEGNLKYKKMGYLRACKVTDNATNADGSTMCTTFYQISGRNVKEGMFLKQEKDGRTYLNLSYSPAAVNQFNLEYGLLLHTAKTLGTMHYLGLSVGYDTRKLEEGVLEEYPKGGKPKYYNFGLNYGIGIHPVRIFELTPNVGFGMDFYAGGVDGDKKKKRGSFYAQFGLRFGIQIWYPVQLFARADYNLIIRPSEHHIPHPDRTNKLSIGGGLKINL